MSLKEPKFKIRQIVKCVLPKNTSISDARSLGGAGWTLNKKFKIETLKYAFCKKYVYFPKNDDGVYEEFLKLVKKEIKEFGIVNFCKKYYK